jgi:hypothetical protein
LIRRSGVQGALHANAALEAKMDRRIKLVLGLDPGIRL